MPMTEDEGLALVEQVLAPRQLNKVQTLIFQQAWQGQSYKETAEQFGYSLGYIKDTGSGLWKLLSDRIGEKVTRQNFQIVLKQIDSQQSQTKDPRSSSDRHYIESPGDVLPAFTSRCDWGAAIDVSIFYNRTTELKTLTQWIQQDRCRLITLLGMGGIGKTSLSVKLAEQLQGSFEYVIWRSLRHAPTLPNLLADLTQVLSSQPAVKSAETLDSQINHLMRCLRQHRCLLVLDNVESILQSGKYAGSYRQGYEGYGQLIARISDERHQSCLVLTSREKPGGILIREGDSCPVRTLQLEGLPFCEGQKLLESKGLQESAINCHRLVRHYSGNPLALKIAAATIASVFGGKAAVFLSQKTVIFGDFGELLDQQFSRLSLVEQQVMYWLAISREAVTLGELAEDIIPKVSPRDLLEALVSLQGRALIETSEAGFFQQPIIMEYMTERLVQQFYHHLSSYEITFYSDYALIKPQAKDFIRAAQIRLILQPVTDKLLAAFGNRQNLENHLSCLLATLRDEQSGGTGYAAVNLLNLFCQLQSDRCDQDFSDLTTGASNRRVHTRSLSQHSVQAMPTVPSAAG